LITLISQPDNSSTEGHNKAPKLSKITCRK